MSRGHRPRPVAADIAAAVRRAGLTHEAWMGLTDCDRVAGRFDHLDLHGTLEELGPEEYAIGRAFSEDDAELPHRQPDECVGGQS